MKKAVFGSFLFSSPFSSSEKKFDYEDDDDDQHEDEIMWFFEMDPRY